MDALRLERLLRVNTTRKEEKMSSLLTSGVKYYLAFVTLCKSH